MIPVGAHIRRRAWKRRATSGVSPRMENTNAKAADKTSVIYTFFGYLIILFVVAVLGAGGLFMGRVAYGEYADFFSSGPQNRAKAHLKLIAPQSVDTCVPLAYGTSKSTNIDEYTCRNGDKVVRCMAGPIIEKPDCKLIVDFAPAAQKNDTTAPAAGATPAATPDAGVPAAPAAPNGATASIPPHPVNITPAKSSKK